MKTHSTFHTLIFLLVVLTFSAPFFALAQQNFMQLEVSKVDAAQDANAVWLEAKEAAEREASNAVNKRSSACVAGYAVAGCTLGALAGCAVGSLFPDNSAYSSIAPGIPSDGMIAGTLIGGIIGLLVPLALTYGSPSNPQPKRLLGKSPEYVESYVNAYKLKVLSLQAK